MANFPLIDLTNLPTNFDELVNKEHQESAGNCYDAHPVSFWEYAKALLELERDDVIGKNAAKTKSGWAINKALAFLFFHSEPVTADDVAVELGYAGHRGVNLLLGDDFGNPLREKLGHLTKPPYDQNDPYQVNLCSFIAFVENNNIGVIFILRHRFRAALAQCFGETELRNWLNAPKPNY